MVTEKGRLTTSRLLVQKAIQSDSGMYTCAPSNANPISVRVHILNGKCIPFPIICRNSILFSVSFLEFVVVVSFYHLKIMSITSETLSLSLTESAYSSLFSNQIQFVKRSILSIFNRNISSIVESFFILSLLERIANVLISILSSINVNKSNPSGCCLDTCQECIFRFICNCASHERINIPELTLKLIAIPCIYGIN